MPGILTVHNQIEGLVLKGVGSAFDTTFLNKYLLSGDGSLKDDSSGRTIIINHFSGLLSWDII